MSGKKYVIKKLLPLILILFVAPCLVFSAPITFICKYDTFSDGDRNSKVEDDFILTFIDDREINKAYLLGNNGSNDVILIGNQSGSFSYIEVTESGNVITTTIDVNGKSVHSRNTTIMGELIPSQYYGNCTMKK